MTIRSMISDKLLDALAVVTSLKYKSFDEVRLAASDFAEWETPAVQLIDVADFNTHEGQRGKKEWNIIIELIVGPTANETPTQKKLWDLLAEIEQAIFVKPNLGLKEVIHCKLVNTSTDLHIMKPFYLGKIEMVVEYYQPLLNC